MIVVAMKFKTTLELEQSSYATDNQEESLNNYCLNI